LFLFQCPNPGGLARILEKMHWSEANEENA